MLIAGPIAAIFGSAWRSILASVAGGHSALKGAAMAGALLGLAIASTLLILAPGPDSLLVMRNTLRGGRRAGWTTASGTISGILVWAVAAALGLSALLRGRQGGLPGVAGHRHPARLAAAGGPGR